MAASRVLRWSQPRSWFCNSARSCSSGYAYGETSQQMQQYYFKRFNLPRNAFGIAFDIDGVLIRGSEPIGRAPDALRRLYKDVEKAELHVPYVFLTNGGGTTEAARAAELTRQLSVPVNPTQVLLGHTPFKSLAKRFVSKLVAFHVISGFQSALGRSSVGGERQSRPLMEMDIQPLKAITDLPYRSRRVLAVGKGDPETALTSYGFPTVVKMDKYYREFEHIDPLQPYKPWAKHETISSNDILMPANERQIAAVFVCSDPVDWGRDLQVLCDVLRAGGYPGNMDSRNPQPPLFFAADDFEYPTKFPVPRFGMGAFRIALESLYVKLAKRPLACTSYGKPKPVVYHLAAKTLHNIANMMYSERGMVLPSRESPKVGRLELPEPGDRARDEGCALKTLYMIGDNPETDIAGAIGMGRPWFSILVRSGCFRGSGNHGKYPADKVVEDVYEAVDFIAKKEGISL